MKMELQGQRACLVSITYAFPVKYRRHTLLRVKSLASVTLVPQLADSVTRFSDAELESFVRTQLGAWFSREKFPNCDVRTWKLLRIYRIPYAQPAQTPPYSRDIEVSLDGRIFVCGDHRGTATLNGAVNSGKRAAKAAL